MKNHVPSILALEPDVRQASILKRMIRDRVHADLIVVDSRDGAVAAVNAQVPDVILLTALLSPRDEAEIIAHLRTSTAPSTYRPTPFRSSPPRPTMRTHLRRKAGCWGNFAGRRSPNRSPAAIRPRLQTK